jgi:HAD superfamily hydrolase (TIGR01509 family)
MKQNLRALLFDLDGTLIDTGELHYQATMRALTYFDRSLDRAAYDRHIHGNNNADIMTYLFPDEDEKKKTDYIDKKETLFRQSLGEAEPMAGLPDLLAWAEQLSLHVGLVTNAPEENKNVMLEAIGLTGRFNPVILGDDLPKAKPHPLPFLTALQRLGVKPEEAIGFDDSVHGITAVFAAGMYGVGVTTGQSADELKQAGADLCVDDFHDPELLNLLSSRRRQN